MEMKIVDVINAFREQGLDLPGDNAEALQRLQTLNFEELQSQLTGLGNRASRAQLNEAFALLKQLGPQARPLDEQLSVRFHSGTAPGSSREYVDPQAVGGHMKATKTMPPEMEQMEAYFNGFFQYFRPPERQIIASLLDTLVNQQIEAIPAAVLINDFVEKIVIRTDLSQMKLNKLVSLMMQNSSHGNWRVRYMAVAILVKMADSGFDENQNIPGMLAACYSDKSALVLIQYLKLTCRLDASLQYPWRVLGKIWSLTSETAPSRLTALSIIHDYLKSNLEDEDKIPALFEGAKLSSRVIGLYKAHELKAHEPKSEQTLAQLDEMIPLFFQLSSAESKLAWQNWLLQSKPPYRSTQLEILAQMIGEQWSHYHVQDVASLNNILILVFEALGSATTAIPSSLIGAVRLDEAMATYVLEHTLAFYSARESEAQSQADLMPESVRLLRTWAVCSPTTIPMELLRRVLDGLSAVSGQDSYLSLSAMIGSVLAEQEQDYLFQHVWQNPTSQRFSFTDAQATLRIIPSLMMSLMPADARPTLDTSKFPQTVTTQSQASVSASQDDTASKRRQLSDDTLTDDEFLAGLRANINDIFQMARSGWIYTKPASWTALPSVGMSVGSLSDWPKLLESAVFNTDGLENLGSIIALSEIVTNTAQWTPDLVGLLGRPNSDSLIEASVLQKHLLVASLLIGQRILRTTEKSPYFYKVFWKLDWALKPYAKQLHEVFAQAHSARFGVDFETSFDRLHDKCDWLKLARQLAFFMTPAHADYVKPGALTTKFPPEIYGPEVKFTDEVFGPYADGSFDEKAGFVDASFPSNGKAYSLGAPGGPFPILEFEKAKWSVFLDSCGRRDMNPPEKEVAQFEPKPVSTDPSGGSQTEKKSPRSSAKQKPASPKISMNSADPTTRDGLRTGLPRLTPTGLSTMISRVLIQTTTTKPAVASEHATPAQSAITTPAPTKLTHHSGIRKYGTASISSPRHLSGIRVYQRPGGIR